MSGTDRQSRRSRLPAVTPETADTAMPETAIAGVVGEAQASRSGEDGRRRGWFWHWNSIITQFAPLIGLKGVGLLNSYTVWTDRREESPHRGYAFPSQQREADFYGEDRAELIALNKILVALDLIEIRKEMVLRVDERGRRWRVPHNFYRVKDHADGFTLTGDKVLPVIALADRDPAVYRVVRHIFSTRFAPIDADNPWHQILPQLRQTPLWQRLAARVAAEEERAAARTRAGHAARGKRAVSDTSAGVATGAANTVGVEPAPAPTFFVPQSGASATSAATGNDTGSVGTLQEAPTSVAPLNTGSAVDVAGTNNGSDDPTRLGVAPANTGLPTAVPAVNNAPPTAVGASNRTYDQEEITTTTTPAREPDDGTEPPPPGEHAVATVQPLPEWGGQVVGESALPLTTTHGSLRDAAGSATVVDGAGTTGPGGQPAPADAPGELAAIRAFEDANARRATPAERQLLRGLAERFQPAAAGAGASGWTWVAAAIYEAVEAGSAFVAPRRIREILTRWERDGAGTATRRGEAAEPGARAAAPLAAGRIEDLLGAGPDLDLPHGFGSRRTWIFTVGLLAGALAPERLADLVTGTAIVGYRDGEVTIAVPDPVQAERLATTYRDLVTRKLSEAMRRPVRLAVLTERREGETSDSRDDATRERRPAGEAALPTAPAATEPGPAAVSFLVPECGLPSTQVWAAVLEEVAARGDVSRANVDAWLRPTVLIGRGADGAFVVGAPHALARRRISTRFLPPLRAAITAVVGVRLPVEVVVAGEWRPAETVAPRDDPGARVRA